MFGGNMNICKVILLSLSLALPCAQVVAEPRSSEVILRDAAARLHKAVLDHRGAVRVGLKSGQVVTLAHVKQALKDSAPEETESYIDSLRAWAASHADLLVDLAKILTGDAIDRGVSKKGLGTADAVAESYVPALAKLADKHGKGIPHDKLVQTLVTTGVKAHFFAGKGTNLDLTADAVQATLGFFDDGVITGPAGWAAYINVTKGMQALTARAVNYIVEVAMDQALAGKLDKQSYKTLVKILTRLCVEPLNPLVERGIKSLQTEQ